MLDRYKILEILGEGGFAKVYKAFDTRLERTVAVKQILVTKKTRHRTHREAKTTALLNHPNVVTLHEFEQTEENFYLIMEYIEGITVEELLKRKSPLSISEAIAIGSQVCLALEYAHLNDVVHRDIKPANLMLLPDGRIKVMDFGIAKLISAAQSDEEHEIFGTAAYMSPEQVNRELVDEASDIYSLGVVMYELLTGENPFRSDSTRSIIFRILHGEPEPLSELNPQVPDELSDVVLRAMDRDPGQRYKNAVEMRYKLERYQPVRQPPEKILKPLAGGLVDVEAQPEPFKLPSFSFGSGLRDFLSRHEEATGRLIVAVPASALAWFVFGPTFAYPNSLSLSIALVAFLATMTSPLLGVVATIFATLLPLAAYSIALSLVALFFIGIYILAVRDPFLILLPFGAPFLAWAQIGFLYPVGTGLLGLAPPKLFRSKTKIPALKSRVSSALMAGCLTGLGSLLLEVSDIFGEQPNLHYFSIINSYHLFKTFQGSNDLIGLFSQLFQPFFQNPILFFQIILWSVVGLTVGFLSYQSGFFIKLTATASGIAILILGYSATASWPGSAPIPLSEMVKNLSFSSIILLVLLFLFSTRPALTEEPQEDQEPEDEESEDELA